MNNDEELFEEESMRTEDEIIKYLGVKYEGINEK